MKFSFLILTILLFCCKSRYSGTIPMYMDEYILTTEERKFELKKVLKGTLIQFQSSYNCKIDSIAYNSTALIQVENGDTLTVYSPCLNQHLATGLPVTVVRIDFNEQTIQQTKREIIKQFPRGHPNFPYWECISCKYPNTVGMIRAR